jgi:deoxyribonucleoside regulator
MSDERLLDELCGFYNRKGGVVVLSGSADEKLLARLIVSQAALYIEELLLKVTEIGLGWGDTIGMLVDELEGHPLVEFGIGYVCLAVGSAPNDIKGYHTNELERIFAEKTVFSLYCMHAPAFPVSLRNRQLFETTVGYQEISKFWHDLEIMMLGIGTYPSVPDQAKAARFDDLRLEKTVGMLATH